jgi:hypothetical protein
MGIVYGALKVRKAYRFSRKVSRYGKRRRKRY